MPAQDGGGSVDRLLDALVALERSALDRWIRLDPQGYLDLQAPEVTYFDPFTERRVDGLDAMRLRLAPMKKMKPPFTDPRYDMIDPKVQRHGDVAASDIQPCQLRKTAGCSGTCLGSLEFHRGL
jgi:hypothetical protein